MRIRPPETFPKRRFQFSLRSAVVLVLLLGAAPLLCYRIYAQFVPIGASPHPFLLASEKGLELPPEGGNSKLRVFFNDGGAAHSGFFWTWIVRYDGWTGCTVVLQGYSSHDVRYGEVPFPAEWDGDVLKVKFCAGRHNSEQVVKTVDCSGF